MAATDSVQRVKVWNSFFALARRDAKGVFELLNNCKVADDSFSPLGGTLGEQPTAVLGALAFCALAIEARANHLIEKLFEDGQLTRKEAEAASYLAPERKWFLLPKLAGRPESLHADRNPHKAIADICALRNAVVHVKFDHISTKLPDANAMLKLYENFVVAMDDLNEVLGYSKGPRKKVRAHGRFKCAGP